jgi:hypothetical protein
MGLSNDTCKNLIDTMQKLNLAATAAALALLSNALLAPDPKTQKAEEELLRLMRIKEQVNKLSPNDFIAEALKNILAAEYSYIFYKIINFDMEATKNLDLLNGSGFGFTVLSFFYSAGHDIRWIYPSDAGPPQSMAGDSIKAADDEKIVSRIAFDAIRMLWNDLGQPKHIFEITDQPRLLSLRAGPSQGEDKGAKLSPPSHAQSQKLFSLDELTPIQLTWVSEKEAHLSRRFGISYQSYNTLGLGPQRENFLKNVQMDLEFDAEYRFDVVQLDILLNHCSPADKTLAHDFAQAFPDLSNWINAHGEYQTLELADLKNNLSEERQAEKRDFDVFGVKIESDQIAIFGLPTLAFLLFNLGIVARYMANHVEKIDVEVASNWSFLLRGWPFEILTLAVAILLPIAAAAATWIRVHDRALLTSILSGVAIVSALFAAHSLFLLRRCLSSESEGEAAADTERV